MKPTIALCLAAALLAACGRPARPAGAPQAQAASAPAAAGGNWALGSWTEVDPSCGTVLKEVFTPTTYRGFSGAWDEHRVTYNVSKEEIWMHVDGGGTWTVVYPVDANHIREEYGKSCIYQRDG